MSRLKGKIWRQLEAAEQAGDRSAFAILARELRQTLGGYFELFERAAKIRPGETIRIHVLYHDGRDELPQTLDNGTSSNIPLSRRPGAYCGTEKFARRL